MKKFPIFLIFLITGLVLFSRSARGPFLFDDEISVLENRYLVGSDHPTLLTIAHNFKPTLQRPITLLSFAVERVFFGKNPIPFHASNILIHVAFCFLAFLFVQIILDDFEIQPQRKQRVWMSLTTAMIVMVHPLTTEAVCYISSRSSLLAWFFILLALIIMPARKALEIHRPFAGRLLAANLFFILGFLCKEEVLVYPLLLFVWIALLPKRQDLKPKVLIRIFAIPIILFCAGLIGVASYGKGLELTRFRPLYTQIATQSIVGWRYVGLYFYPFFQNIDPDVKSVGSVLDIRFLFSMAMWITLGVFLWIKRAKHPLYLLLFAFFFLGLAINSIVPLPDLMAERRMYFSLIPLTLGLIVSAEKYLRRQKMPQRVGIVILIGYFAACNFHRQEVFTSELALWQDAVLKSPKKWRPHFNLGNTLRDQIKAAKSTGERNTTIKQAILSFEKAVELNPSHVPAISNLGHLYYSTGDLEKSRDVYLAGLRVDPSSPELHVNLGMLYYNTRNLQPAKVEFEKALASQPNNPSALLNLGMVFHQENDVARAENLYLQAIKEDPHSAAAHNNLCVIYKEMKRYEEAIDQCKMAIDANPDLQMAYIATAETYLEAGAIDYAIINLEKLLKINPTHMQGWFLLAKTAVIRHENAQAKVFFNNALIYARRVNDQNFIARVEKELAKIK